MRQGNVHSASAKKLSQTKISSYFTGCVKSVPQKKKTPSKRKTTRRRISFSSTMASETTNASEYFSLIAEIPKRKLPVPIFSDDETSDAENRSGGSSTVKTTPKKQKLTISINKQISVISSHSTCLRWKSFMESQNNNLPEGTLSCSPTSSEHFNFSQKNVSSNESSQAITPSRAKTKSDNLKSSKKNPPPNISLQAATPCSNTKLDAVMPSCSKINDSVGGGTPSSSTSSAEDFDISLKKTSANESSQAITSSRAKTKSDNLKSSTKKSPPNISLQVTTPCSKTKLDAVNPSCSKINDSDGGRTPSCSTSSSEDSDISSKKISANESLHAATAFFSKTNANESSRPICVLQNIVVQTPKKSPQKSPKKSPQKNENVKDESKKVNYEQLKVMREFFINVLKNNYLADLLSGNDREFLHNFYNAEKNYQYVCVKLFLWKPTWYNIFKFVDKIGLAMIDSQITAMYKYLSENGYVDVNYMGEDLFTLLDILSLKEVRELGRSFRLTNVCGAKDVVISKLIKTCKTQSTLTLTFNTEDILKKRIREKMGHCVKLSARFYRCLYSIFLLNTFTNSSLVDPQDYFTNVSYFNVVFPPFTVENFHIFYTPQEFLRYADAIKLRSELDKVLENRNSVHILEICKCAHRMLIELNNEHGDGFDDSKEPHLERFTPNAKYISILSSGSKQITTQYYHDVMNWYKYLLSQKYCSHKRGEWYCQLALIYTQYVRCHETAAKLLIKALKEEKEHFSDIQLQELAHRGRMLNKKTYNLPALYHDEIAALSPPTCDRAWPQDVLDCKSMQSEESGKKRVYVRQCKNGDVNYLTVEQTALEYYREIGFPSGEHCEGRLIIAAFCLLFWDIIYETYVKGTFVSKVQNVPLDMYTEYFYINREKPIKKKLREISEKWSDEELKKRISINWDRHSHESSLCQIDAAVEGPQHLYNIIMCIGRSVLAKIFERLVKNVRIYQSGFPDLIVWNLQEKKAKFVEVKSENDKLSIKQKLWLNYLMDIGASVAVCHVEPKASKKKLAITKK